MGKGDEYINEYGRLKVDKLTLKFCCLILGIAVVLSVSFNFILISKLDDRKPLPIFVNDVTGVARAVSFEKIDASGEKRSDKEVENYIKTFFQNLYTFNKFTIKSNLVNALNSCSHESINTIKGYYQDWIKQEYIDGNYQGLCDVLSILAMDMENRFVTFEVRFKKKVLSQQGDVDKQGDFVAILKVIVTVRTEVNPHGIVIAEYRESEIKKNSEG